MQRAVHAGRRRPRDAWPRPSAAPATSPSPSSRRLQGQDGRVRPAGDHGAKLHGRHAGLAHRPLCQLAARSDPCREHRADQGPGRQVHARAQGAHRCRCPTRRLYPGRLRPADDRRIQGGRACRRSRCSRSRSTSRTSSTGWPTSRAFGAQAVFLDDRDETAALDPMRAETWQPSMAELKAAGVNILAPPIWYMLTLERRPEDDPLALRAGCQGSRARADRLVIRARRDA